MTNGTTNFLRFCKTMELRNDDELIHAYKKAHAQGAAWPEVTLGMKEVGILDMEIYLLGTTLFMIMDTVPDFNHALAMETLAQKPRQSEWEQYMSRFQHSAGGHNANEKWQMMERIYKMEK